ncbi:MAG: sigma-54 factor interaction domain-containing protein, partial [Bacteroidales bacterium]|nr:sigma-54 factor interaction domain-containing protein [Bacteroidales bacterium]
MDIQALKNKYDIIGNDPALNDALETAVKFAPTGLSVLIEGESGVGKESFARIIHQYSARRGKEFFVVNCGALARDLVNSELFGHVRGAFTGSVETRKGYFEVANGGTLFMDEIAELPLESQALLLRVLQSGEYRKVGSNTIEHTDV